ncbi:hypothetical protein DZ774_10100 [Enterococcus faecalis]|nr:hypothetical protein [Enterococcus faecalis]
MFKKNERGTEPTPSEISRNSPKIKDQFSEISSYFSELNGSVPTSSNALIGCGRANWCTSCNHASFL